MKYRIKDLIEIERKGQHLSFAFFWGPYPKDGKYAPFSQWYISEFTVDNVKYVCMEQYMMAMKAMMFNDKAAFDLIMATTDPKNIKALGRKVRDFNDNTWNTVVNDIVLKGNIAKFSQNLKLKDLLVSTRGMILAEASPYDRRWGIGLDARSPKSVHPSEWLGENRLGFILMEVRDML